MQVMRCVREARQTMIAAGGTVQHVDATVPAYRRHNDEALRVKNWLPGSYSRLKRSMEFAITHPTGRGIPVLWRMYMSMEASASFLASSIGWFPAHVCSYLAREVTLSKRCHSCCFYSGHARELLTGEAIVLARGSRVPRQQGCLDGRSSREPTRSGRRCRAEASFPHEGAQRGNRRLVGEITSPPS